MSGWVERSLAALEKQREGQEQQKRTEAQMLAIRVSRLLGEVVPAEEVSPGEEPSLEARDGNRVFRFVFANDQKDALAIRWRCPSCDDYFLIPVATLADIGSILQGERDLRPLAHLKCPKGPAG